MPKNKTAFGKLTKIFEKLSEKVSDIVGSPWWFVFSVAVILLWIPSRFFIRSAELWHLLINTSTTILTFLMMALLHSSQKKWEDEIEKLQQRESSEIRFLKKHTKKIAYDAGKPELNQREKVDKEDDEINSIL